MSDSQEMYPLGRDEVESRRLNEQHKFLLDVVDGAIDRDVPLDNISAVADVATGTGIWLWDAKQILDQKAGESSSRSYHGFDISPAQFPSTPQGIELSVQDVFQPFPAEFINRFDLVHVRLMVTAFPESKFQEAVENVLTILKPGGYLQWVEIDFSTVEAQTNTDARVSPGSNHWMRFVDLNQMSRCAPDALFNAFKTTGLQNVSNKSFRIRGRPELRDRAQTWQMQFFAGIMPVVLVRLGEAADMAEAARMAEPIRRDLESYFKDGEVVDTRFGTVLGQKPL
ncbi:S-adenosyl-L-methionine-dependent methyltransferase [Aspergillus carlsbadensis]|nr:S-adenosyl-L-methionine-dependent methyltransferase [Aspergillus carlsbadensis]